MKLHLYFNKLKHCLIMERCYHLYLMHFSNRRPLIYNLAEIMPQFGGQKVDFIYLPEFLLAITLGCRKLFSPLDITETAFITWIRIKMLKASKFISQNVKWIYLQESISWRCKWQLNKSVKSFCISATNLFLSCIFLYLQLWSHSFHCQWMWRKTNKFYLNIYSSLNCF